EASSSSAASLCRSGVVAGLRRVPAVQADRLASARRRPADADRQPRCTVRSGVPAGRQRLADPGVAGGAAGNRFDGRTLMTPEELQQCLEEAFGDLEPPFLEELAASDTYMDESFVDQVNTGKASVKRWQELRPMSQYIGDYSEIVLFSPKA